MVGCRARLRFSAMDPTPPLPEPLPQAAPTSFVSPGSPELVLFPTQLELARFEDQGGLPPGFALCAVAGFGPVAAAARTAELLARLRPRRVWLVGIAGAYDIERHPTGTALLFERVASHGVGAGEGDAYRGPTALGFPQWPGSPASGAPPVEEELPLHVPAATPADLCAALLVSTCAASASPGEAQRRRDRYPDGVAEDMEGFGVALACALARVPLCVVRGISNEVGDRDGRNWRIPAALAASRRLLLELLGAEDAQKRELR